MSMRTMTWRVVVVALLFGLGAGDISARQGAQGRPDLNTGPELAAIQRSQSVQAELARIEANKEAFIEELFGRWAPYVDPMVYDIWGSLKPIAMAATPWRLLGASLTTDFESGVRVLRGVVGPGRYISAYIEGREPVLGAATANAQLDVSDPSPTAIGAVLSSLVFTPITPCRVVDTRGVGSRTGMLQPNETRTFDLSAAGLAEGQGGAASCPGLPTYNHKAWAVSIAATSYSANGHLNVWPYSYAMTDASFLNFSPSIYAIANAGSVTGCSGCVDSINVRGPTATHVIIDVMGYYEEATGFASGAATTLVGTDTNIAAGSGTYVSGAACPVGTVIVGGTAYVELGLISPADHEISGGTTWREFYRNTTGGSVLIRVASRCMDVH